MEPVDPRMGELLSGDGGGGPDELRSIVSRAGRTRTRVAAAAAGVALAAGGGLGYGISSATSGGSRQQIVATAPQSAGVSPSGASGIDSPSGAPAVAVPNPSIAQPLKYQKVFTRQVGTVDIRGFLQPMPAVPYGVPAVCVGAGGWTRFQAEVSTPGMVGIVFGLEYQQSSAGGPIEFTQPQVVGSAEGDPVAVVVAHTSSDVAQVRMQFAGGGSDQMAPVQGWSALATPYPGGTFTSPATFGTLTALDRAGRTLAQQTVEVAPRPLPALPVNPGKPAPNGSGSAGSGSAGSGSTGPGSVGSGSAGSGSVGSGSAGSAGSGSGSVGGGSPSSGTAASPPASSSPPVSVVSPPASSPQTTSPGKGIPPGTTIYPCEVTPLPAQVPPASSSANAGSGG